MTKRIRVGCDPELFVKPIDSEEHIPICGKIGGTKDKPLALSKEAQGFPLGKNYGLQEDGAALEFNTPPFSDMLEFGLRIDQFMKWLPKYLAPKGLRLSYDCVATFKPEAFKEFPDAMRFGCDPDFDPYERSQRPPIEVEQVGNQRFAAGHLHLGYDTQTVPVPIMAQLLDLMVGIPCVHLDKQGPRRQFYGVPGLYREKPYGVEYRTLSNFWLRPDTIGEDGNFVHLLARCLNDIAYWAETNNQLIRDLYKAVPWDDVRTAIQTENDEMATAILQFAHKMAPEVMRIPRQVHQWQVYRDPNLGKMSKTKTSKVAARV